MPSVVRRASGRFQVYLWNRSLKRRQYLMLPASIRTLRDARRAATELQDQLDHQTAGLAPSRADSARGFIDIAAEVLAEVEIRNGRNWSLSTHKFVARFAAYVGDCAIDSITEDHCRLYLLDAIERGANASHLRKEILFLRRVFRRAVRKAVIVASPWDGLSLPSEPPRDPQYLTPSEFRALCDAAPPNRAFRYRLFAFTGARRSEAMALTWDDVDLTRRQVRIRNASKGRSPRYIYRVVPIPASLAEELAARRPPDGSGRVLRMSLSKYAPCLKRDCEAAGIRPVTLVALRHTFGSWLAQEGVPLIRIRDLMGHRSIETTQIYAHLSPLADSGPASALEHHATLTDSAPVRDASAG